MWITNSENRPIDFYINKRWLPFKAREKRNLEESFVIGIIERFPYGGWELDKKDIAYIKKTKTEVIIVLKSGKEIVQRKPEELRFLAIAEEVDPNKIQIAIFMKNIITHYSGGRYWAWLLGHILADAPNVQVTFITNQKPPFGKSFDCFRNKNVFIYVDDPKNLYRMGDKISKNIFDCIVGIPIEGGISAQTYAEKWAKAYYCLLFESPNFIRDYRGGPDSEDTTWHPYIPVLRNAEKVINNTEIGKDYLDDWMTGGFDKARSTWLWNSINTKAADKVNQKENAEKDLFHVLFVGRVLGFKGLTHIVRALNLLTTKKFIVHIVTGHAGTIIAQMQSEAGKHIEVKCYDKIDDYEKFRIIKQCNLMFFLSSFEGFGMPPMEALYCERLCIAYPLPILKLIYKDHLIYAKKGDIKDVASQVETWLDNPAKRKKHIAEAKKYIDGVADHEGVRKRFFQLTGLDKLKKEPVDEKPKFKTGPFDRQMKLTFGIIVCNGAQFIIHCLKHIYDMADEIIICEGAVEQYDRIVGSFYSNDKTIELIRDFQENRDPMKKIKMFTSKKFGRAWKNKMEMQNVIAENTTGDIFIKQDVDEFYDLEGLAREIDRLKKDKGRIMINYKSYHFWGDYKHLIVGSNFNDKQTRVWRWRDSFRYIKTFNWVTDTATGQYTPPEAGNSLISEDTLFHYNYIYENKSRLDVLKYYAKRSLGDHKDVHRAWTHKNPDLLEGGRCVKPINLKHPVSQEVLEDFIK